MSDIRRHFHDDLASMEHKLLGMGEVVRGAVEDASHALLEGGADRAQGVVDEIEALDAAAIEFERHWLETMALQTPVASDLRLMSVLMNCNHSVNRVGHQAKNISRVVLATEGMPRHAPILQQLKDMSDRVGPMLRLALEAFANRNSGLAPTLIEMDQPVNELNRDMYKLVVECAGDPDTLEWASRMMVVARAYERIGDRSISIAQQVQFLVTGSYEEDEEVTPR
jgi:phosphate transport system protein